jgi:hypothetical protein
MRQRGFTFITFLVLVGALAAIFWIITYGPAYVESFEVGRIVREAGNLTYKEGDDEKVKDFIMLQLQMHFSEDQQVGGRTEHVLKLDIVRNDDIRIERSEVPKQSEIWVTWRRTITIPFVGGERQISFTKHVEQDLTPVKW